ncbi:serine-tRNA ligase [Fragilariopsis cylindrus CCMP1102]|uniref:serine--tRNA ligase n=1 Tax=Fragilariopsis cylindrus CCMP1102 TaxID=635003 RepID=A0A1E7FDC6_9STRA|nr:serine-tRNA ligase [Fragilariopsis cylindrus CCMP1102]|eukprot:OEU16045.1 serine-tRNA ligase [Fragilariopsis cylindrus CCMP1102]
MPIDINELRDYKGGDPAKYRKYMEQRFKPVEWVDEVIAEDEKWRAMTKKKDDLRKQVNKIQKEKITPKKKAKEDCTAEVAEMKAVQEEIKDVEAQLPLIAASRDKLLNRIGNRVDPEVPISNDEDEDNLGSLKYTLPETKPLTHDELLWRIGGYEPTRGSNVAGHRAYFLTNAGVLLNQAIINYGIAFLSARDYNVVQPPFFMNKDVMASIAQLDDFDEQLYKVSGKTDDPEGESKEKYLIATSEQPLCAYHKDEWVERSSLPLRYAGISTCFRKEAGSSGRDIRGIFRVHQFEKIEQFCIVDDDYEASQAEHKRMLTAAKEFYDSLGFAYRVVCLVSNELNDAATKKYDLEAWFPGQNAYRELVSCSNCTDYQARGVNIRCGGKKEVKKGDLSARQSYVHMLNATLCATGRGICCLLETYQTPDGVIVPEVLRPYMGGKEFLPFVREAQEVSKGEKNQKNKK